MTKNVECPYCGEQENRQALESGQVSHGQPMTMYRVIGFRCEHCGRYFWKREKVQK